ncbi:5743_t:CDS:2, partial [Gigaspora rosea]
YTTAADSSEFSTRPITDAEVNILERFARYSFLTNDQSISEVANWTCDTCKEITNDTKSIIVKPVRTADLVNDYIADIGSFNLVKYSVKNPQSSRFNKDIRVSEGFFTVWQRFQSSNLTSTLTSFMKGFPSFNVSVTGHSLGGALGLFQTLDIKQNLPKAKLCFYGFNMPRGGNEYFANYVNEELDCIYRVVSKADLISRVPPRPFWVQPKGEVWIFDPHKQPYTKGAIVCSGNDNPNCSLSVYPNFFDHLGPFFG